jgi:hypothetical protein
MIIEEKIVEENEREKESRVQVGKKIMHHGVSR